MTEIEKYAAAVHAVMAAGYALSIPYHVRRRNGFHLLIHVLGVAYHGRAVAHHLRDDEPKSEKA